MSRPLLVLLIASVAASGCSRDAPPLAPEPAAVELITAAPAIAQRLPNDDVDDALARLEPALGRPGSPLRGALLRLQAQPNDRAALTAVQQTLDALAVSISEEFLPDLDALRLQLGIPFPE